MKHSQNKYIIYHIYYGQELVYVGRTTQTLQNRIRGHVFKQKLLRAIDIDKVSQIFYAELPTEADMFLYEIYYINRYHPKLNKDDKARDDLTVELPELDFSLFTTHLWEKWKEKIHAKDTLASIKKIILDSHNEDYREERQLAREKYKKGEISDDEYSDELVRLEQNHAKFLYEENFIDFYEYKQRMGWEEAESAMLNV